MIVSVLSYVIKHSVTIYCILFELRRLDKRAVGCRTSEFAYVLHQVPNTGSTAFQNALC
jgi:hypothetical protein